MMNAEHWKKMMVQAANNVASIMNYSLDVSMYVAPTTEDEAKEMFACALRNRCHFSCMEMAELQYEISEFATAHMMYSALSETK